MLIKFRVENYLSFNDEQCLSLIKGQSRNLKNHVYELDEIEVLRTAAIFGANASGKTNLIEAIFKSWLFIVAGNRIPSDEYCRINIENKEKPSAFEYEFEINGDTFVYGFETILSSMGIVHEWLYDLSGQKKTILFERFNDEIKTDLKLEKNDQTRFSVYAEDLKIQPDRLFLTEISRRRFDEKSQMSVFYRIIKWLSSNIRIITVGAPTGFAFTQIQTELSSKVLSAYGTGVTEVCYEILESGYNPIPQQVIDDLFSDFKKRNNRNPMTGEIITALRNPENLEPLLLSLDDSGNAVVKKLVFRHGDQSFYYAEESDGTNRLLDLLPILSPDSGNDAVYIIDELDRSMHPQLTEKFIKDFETLCDKTKRQLIFTTHESRVMDLDILRRDEIWFTEKKNGNTVLFSLEEFKERGDRRIYKAYSEGRYGARPCFKSLYPALD